MNNYRVSHPTKILKGSITLTASKSESNRALIIQALCEESFEIKNLAAAEDTTTLQRILVSQKLNINSQKSVSSEKKTQDSRLETQDQIETYDVGAAGTTMRFLTAYLSTQSGTCILTGSERMKNRPIGILVNALRELGADIEYLEKEGYPPLKIKGKELTGRTVEIDGSVSSQYISALMLISPQLKNGLEIKFKGEVTSIPYINMSAKMLEEFGIQANWSAEKNSIVIDKGRYRKKSSDYVYEVEGDWSSASYWYAFAALAKDVNFTIKGLKRNSLQGDAAIARIFESSLGVGTDFIIEGIHLSKKPSISNKFEFNFSDCPDLAQTVATVVAALQIPSQFTGLHTLRIKETDRTAALKNELKKLDTEVEIISDEEIHINPQTITTSPSPISTYEDHRMAMAFAVFAMSNSIDAIEIEHPDVVKKSYPDFWNDLKSVGFIIEEIQ
jgi:3-phosphoshikimate 1-carboxyvinyltransferase